MPFGFFSFFHGIPPFNLLPLQDRLYQTDYKVGKHIVVIQPRQPDTSIDLGDHALSDLTA